MPQSRQAFRGRPGRPSAQPDEALLVGDAQGAVLGHAHLQGEVGLGGHGGAGAGAGPVSAICQGRAGGALPGQAAGGVWAEAPGRRSGRGRPAAQGLQVAGGEFGQALRGQVPQGAPPGRPRGPRRPVRWACPGRAPGRGRGSRSPPGSGPRGPGGHVPDGFGVAEGDDPEKLRWKPRSGPPGRSSPGFRCSPCTVGLSHSGCRTGADRARVHALAARVWPQAHCFSWQRPGLRICGSLWQRWGRHPCHQQERFMRVRSAEGTGGAGGWLGTLARRPRQRLLDCTKNATSRLARVRSHG